MLNKIDKKMTQDEMAYERTEMSSERTAMATERTALAQERTAMAVEQTEMAYTRTVLTNSQTLLAYTRTAIALLATGIGMFEFVNNQAIINLGMIIMLIAPVVEAIGLVHFILVRRRLKEIFSESSIDVFGTQDKASPHRQTDPPVDKGTDPPVDKGQDGGHHDPAARG